MAQLIDGQAIAQALRDEIATQVTKVKQTHGCVPGLAVVLVGEDPASHVYVRNKGIATKQAGMNSFEYRLPADTPQAALLEKIDALNKDPHVHGILVQFPVPAHICQQAIIDHIAPEKDVDGLHPLNAGRLASGLNALTPCTPTGCVHLAKSCLGDDLSGKHVVIIGRSNLVGKPAAQLFLQENCTPSLTHSRTRNLPALCRMADILVAAVGIPHFVKGEWVNEGACIIDVGINRIGAPEKGTGKTRLVGDVDFAAAQHAGFITPVPGGVGPMTIAMLLQNTLAAFHRQIG